MCDEVHIAMRMHDNRVLHVPYTCASGITAGTYVGLRDNFHNYNGILDRVQKQLENYLESRRQLFPRFYFLGNKDEC